MKKRTLLIALLFTIISTHSCKNHLKKPTQANSSNSKQVKTSCIDSSKTNPTGICTMDWNPVCGCDGKSYSNACAAENAGVTTYKIGECNSIKK